MYVRTLSWFFACFFLSIFRDYHLRQIITWTQCSISNSHWIVKSPDKVSWIMKQTHLNNETSTVHRAIAYLIPLFVFNLFIVTERMRLQLNHHANLFSYVRYFSIGKSLSLSLCWLLRIASYKSRIANRSYKNISIKCNDTTREERTWKEIAGSSHGGKKQQQKFSRVSHFFCVQAKAQSSFQVEIICSRGDQSFQ